MGGAGSRLRQERRQRRRAHTIDRALRLVRDEGVHAIHRIGGDATTEAQAADQLAVVHRQPPECGLRHPGTAAELGYVAQERFAQRTTSGYFPGK